MDLETGDNRFHCLEKVSFLSVQVTPLKSYLFFLSTHQRLEFFLEILNVFGQQWPAEFAVRRESDITINVRESLHHSTEGRRFHLIKGDALLGEEPGNSTPCLCNSLGFQCVL